MTIAINLIQGLFVDRPNRFLARVIIDDKIQEAFLPNPGRLKELLTENSQVFLEKKTADRKTRFDLIAVRHGKISVLLDTRVPNRFFSEAFRAKAFDFLRDYKTIKSEASWGNSRFDFLLTNNEECLAEAKSCTLVENGRALFPDAPTLRGTRHVLELIRARKRGFKALILFLIQRPDSGAFSPNQKTDPAFTEALRKALKHGVEIRAIRSMFQNGILEATGEIPVEVTPTD